MTSRRSVFDVRAAGLERRARLAGESFGYEDMAPTGGFRVPSVTALGSMMVMALLVTALVAASATALFAIY